MYWIGFIFAFVLMVGWTLYQANKNRVLMLKDIALLVLASVFSWAAIVVGSIILVVILFYFLAFKGTEIMIWKSKDY